MANCKLQINERGKIMSDDINNSEQNEVFNEHENEAEEQNSIEDPIEDPIEDRVEDQVEDKTIIFDKSVINKSLENGASEPSEKKSNKNMLISFAASIALIAAAVLFFFVLQPSAPAATFDDTPTKQITTTLPPPLPFEGIEDRPSFDELLEKYPETIGWMQVPGTRVNGIVMQGDTYERDKYWLRHTKEGREQECGENFMDFRCNVKPTENLEEFTRTIVVYGHNDLAKKLFADLLGYKKLDFYKENPIIKFDTKYENTEWKVFSAFITDARCLSDSNVEPFDFRAFRVPGEATDVEFMDFTEQLRFRSLFFTNVDIIATDQILVLQTCTSDLGKKGDLRFIVCARKTRPYEDRTVDVSNAAENPKPMYFTDWYKIRGGTPPTLEEFHKNDIARKNPSQ